MNFMKKAVVSTISWYCTHSPIEPGKTRLQKLGLKILDSPSLPARSSDGLKFILEFPQDGGWDIIYFRGTYETGTLKVLQKIISADDIVFDIGANIGWYTTHIAKSVPSGHCHAFEPMPRTFGRLRKNCALNDLSNVTFNQLALGEEEGVVSLHSFENLGHGHNSLSTLGRTDFTSWQVPMTTLDHYLVERNITRVDLVKMDVEGAEMGVVQGARSLFELPSPPIWIIEMNVETAASFGHAPHDLLKRISDQGEYTFYRIERGWGDVKAMASLNDYRHGDNAVCVPASRLDWWRKNYF